MTPTFAPTSRRARILREAQDAPVRLSDLCRRLQARTPASRKDESLMRLKVTSALRNLQRDRLMTRTPSGWATTRQGAEALAQLERQ